MKFETLAIHTANTPDPHTGSVAPSIHLSTTFARHPSGELRGEFSYTRDSNPNRRDLEEAIAQLEGGEEAIAFSSGLAAIQAVFQLVKPGGHIIAPIDVYHGTATLIRGLETWGISSDLIDFTDLDQLESALKENTRLILIETPSNPQLAITDIRLVTAVAKNRGIPVAVDNTWMTPYFQRPFELGADLVVHSSTKYFGGHSDVMGGVVIAKKAGKLSKELRADQQEKGAVPSPFDCWLIRRGLMTLPVRMQRHAGNALKAAEYLTGHSRISQVLYPGLETHPGHHIANSQMTGFGGMLSVLVKGGEAVAAETIARVSLFTRATSLGGVESLIEHRYAVEGPGGKTPNNLLRLSIGLEHPDDLIADLEQALN